MSNDPRLILTMAYSNGETHLERYRRAAGEERERTMAFITSPEVREAMKVLCRDILTEEIAKARSLPQTPP